MALNVCHVILFSYHHNPKSAKIRIMDDQWLLNNITKLLQRVRSSSQKSQYGNSDILVVAVSKTRSAKDIRGAYTCGLFHFGENYVQEALQKIPALEDLPLVWHFIGPIQSNKTGSIAKHFDWVHSIDREKIARRLSEQRSPNQSPLQICLQVNISGESSKSGIPIEELPQLARSVLALPNLKLRGLMAVPAANTDPEQQRKAFGTLRDALLGLKKLDPDIDTLSMGMSADMESAILEGATMVRVGTAIFGPRNR